MPSPTTSPTRLLLDSAALKTMLRMGRTAFYELIKRRDFPTPVVPVDGGDYLWFEDEVVAWMETRRRHPADLAEERRAREAEHPKAAADDTDASPASETPAAARPGASSSTPASAAPKGLVPIAKGTRKPGPKERQPLTAEALKPRGVKRRARVPEEGA